MAFRMPMAIMSHLMMPPKMLTRTALTWIRHEWSGRTREKRGVRLYALVIGKDSEGFGDLLLGGSAAHVQEVGRAPCMV